jgi:hypothetical protein
MRSNTHCTIAVLCAGGFGSGKAALDHGADHNRSTAQGEACILVDVHSMLRESLTCRNIN